MIERYTREEMGRLWSEHHKFSLWLEVETVAIEEMAAMGMVPSEAARAVRERGAFEIARINELEREVKHDVIAFLTSVSEKVGEEARYLHLGMTSSDLLDTAFAIQLRESASLVLEGLDTLLEAVRRRADEHRSTLCIGRSHGIHAEPTTFGLKLAVWFAELKRHRDRLIYARDEISTGALSGPVGTFAHLNPEIEARVCERLGLKADPASTQVIQRDRHAHLFSVIAGLGASIEKFAIEVRHLQRTEVREAEEFFSKGQKGSSAMPHKRNPILSENVTGLSRLLRAWAGSALENIALWHERDISHSSVERVIAPDAMITIDFMLARITRVVDGLVVYPEAMLRNISLTGGLFASGSVLVALCAKGVDRDEAYRLIQSHALQTWEAVDLGKAKEDDFVSRLKTDPKVQEHLSIQELEQLCSVEHHTRHVDSIFERVFSED